MKAFRPTPNMVQDSMKIITGNKVNSSVKDLSEDMDETKEQTATVVSINKGKINGDGWVVMTSDGMTYKASCASNLYEVPKSKERDGILYPTSKIQCKVKINSVLGVAVITQIGSSKKTEEKIDISKWTHKNQDTTVIAKTKSAISISDGMISFNYDNKNTVDVNSKGISINGRSVNIETENLTVNNKPIQNLFEPEYMPLATTDNNDNVLESSNENLAEYTLLYDDFEMTDSERVIANVLYQTQTPRTQQKFPLLTSEGIDELNIYPSGIITVKARNNPSKRSIHHTQNWVPQPVKNIIEVTVGDFCNYCFFTNNSNMSYINYCPICNSFNMLKETNKEITCTQCSASFCKSCGHFNDIENNSKNLKQYAEHHINITSTTCKYCNEILDKNQAKQYVNYCPICKKWDSLDIEAIPLQTDVVNQVYCKECNIHFCGTCGTEQSNYNQVNFKDKVVLYSNYIKKMNKLLFIKES